MSEPAVDDYRFGRLRLAIGIVIARVICHPKLVLGRRRHDNFCDECGDRCGNYAMGKLDFPFDVDGDAVSGRSAVENIRGMLDAEYRRVCLECGHELEQAGGEPGE
ncbi:hypothetical protein NDI85_21405 [Halomicroarcula sp. S1AR25-4]|uniref:hypothetical protein n=1 Tax=Haloarcula sp. S1AR25-4 TaxID=2950538 RepID=UPI002875E36C|nr:hypothetical protein [Halomicroarcula sp. S1AR25-4]MDS0280346.1 hypothetical protein [Halomicroarcula sp. S1AR25-4]